jgi:glycosyltransferase involved in cell wall biosynthesis
MSAGMALDNQDAPGAPAAARLRIMFLVRSLGMGGAERQLVTLATGLAARGHGVRVTTCYEPGVLATDLEQHDVALSSLHQTGALALLGPLGRLRDEVRRWQPDILHGYMPTSNLLSALATDRNGPRLVWGVRASAIEWADYGLLARASFGLTRLMARRANLIIANSEAGRRFHAAENYPTDRMIVIPNGIDVDRFRPDGEARVAMRAAWQLPVNAVVIGAVARLDPMKDHATLLRAFAASRAFLGRAVLVCAGGGSDEKRRELGAMAEALGIGDQVRWLDANGPVERLYPAFDVHTSASAFGEGFSNAVAEAMACGVPCVATDVGDAASLLGDTGVLVPARDPAALAAGWQRLLSDDHRRLGALARERIVSEFSAERLVSRSEEAFRALVATRPRPA